MSSVHTDNFAPSWSSNSVYGPKLCCRGRFIPVDFPDFLIVLRNIFSMPESRSVAYWKDGVISCKAGNLIFVVTDKRLLRSSVQRFENIKITQSNIFHFHFSEQLLGCSFSSLNHLWWSCTVPRTIESCTSSFNWCSFLFPTDCHFTLNFAYICILYCIL